MPSINDAWRAVRSFMAGARRSRPSAPDNQGHGNNSSVHWYSDAPDTVHSVGSRLVESYERIREQLLEAQRKSDLARQDAMRRDRRARRRALTLLLKLMSPEQREEFRVSRHFHVTGGSSRHRYRIRVDKIANIDVLGDDGKVKYRLCVLPAGSVPVYDVMAAQLLHLQDPATEERLLRQANALPALAEDHLYSRTAWTV
jgi:hypothetical protein